MPNHDPVVRGDTPESGSPRDGKDESQKFQIKKWFKKSLTLLRKHLHWPLICVLFIISTGAILGLFFPAVSKTAQSIWINSLLAVLVASTIIAFTVYRPRIKTAND
ncbi:MAG: hypothetical protein V1916_01810, partial [Patescibacteria group bacterium]